MLLTDERVADVLATDVRVAYVLVTNERKADVLVTALSKLSLCFQFFGSGSGIRCLFDPWTLDPGSGMGKKLGSGSGSRMNNPNHISLQLRNHFLGLKYLIFDADLGSGMEKIRIRDPG